MAVQVRQFLEDELTQLEKHKGLALHNVAVVLLEKQENRVESLGKLLGDIEEDTTTQPLDKSDVVKMFAELCLVLKSASEQTENLDESVKKEKAKEYEKLFKRATSLRNQIEYSEAVKMGFEGTIEEYVKQMDC